MASKEIAILREVNSGDGFHFSNSFALLFSEIEGDFARQLSHLLYKAYSSTGDIASMFPGKTVMCPKKLSLRGRGLQSVLQGNRFGARCPPDLHSLAGCRTNHISKKTAYPVMTYLSFI